MRSCVEECTLFPRGILFHNEYLSSKETISIQDKRNESLLFCYFTMVVNVPNSESPIITNDDIGKRKSSVKEEKENSDPLVVVEPPKKKKKKGPRVSQEVIFDAAANMLDVLVQNYKDGIQEIPMDILAGSITDKRGKPYRNHRSDAIVEGMKHLKAEGKAEKSKGVARLMQAEIDKIPKEVISKDPSKVLEQRKIQFLERLAKHKKGGTGATVVEAANAVWNKLRDGQFYSRKELVAMTSYKGTNSSGFEGIMKVLLEIGMIESRNGKNRFTDKVFPYGRP